MFYRCLECRHVYFTPKNQDYPRELTSCVRRTNQPRWCLENGASEMGQIACFRQDETGMKELSGGCTETYPPGCKVTEQENSRGNKMMDRRGTKKKEFN